MKKFIFGTAFMVILNLVCAAQANIPLDTMAFGNSRDNYPGGETAYKAFISKNGRYPKPAESINLMGATYVRFVIETDGNLSNIVIYKGIGAATEIESMRLIKESGKWIPAKTNGVPVKTKCLVPIGYFIEDGKTLEYNVKGEPVDPTDFVKWAKIESMGIALEEAGQFVGKTIKFVGKVYSYKAVNDTTLVMTCGDASYHGEQNRVEVRLIGKDAQIKSPKYIVGKIITGYGDVTKLDDVPVILVNSRTQINFPKSPNDF